MPRFNPNAVAWQDSPPLERGPWYPLLRPGPVSPIRGWILSESVTGVYTHYFDKRTVPCYGSRDCPYCGPDVGRRWKGYLAIATCGIHKISIAELTIEAYRGNPSLHSGKSNLRGSYLTLIRNGKHKNAPVVAELSVKGGCPHLPPDIDVRMALVRVWSGESKAVSNADLMGIRMAGSQPPLN
jgi:hypothetical protein